MGQLKITVPSKNMLDKDSMLYLKDFARSVLYGGHVNYDNNEVVPYDQISIEVYLKSKII